ncbi:MAG TPA: hypothetical protein VIM98_07120 [Dyella sp.]|uniref:hypothetical protein n=1 Tax=Dyella sp. TaxID=1869338 RepID=UPI002F95D7F3
MSQLPVFLSVLLGYSPAMAISVVGLIVAAVCWQRTPQGALLLIVASSIQLLLTLFNAWLYGGYLPRMQQSGESVAGMAQMLGFWTVLGGVLHALVYGLLIWAVFAGRGKAERATP